RSRQLRVLPGRRGRAAAGVQRAVRSRLLVPRAPSLSRPGGRSSERAALPATWGRLLRRRSGARVVQHAECADLPTRRSRLDRLEDAGRVSRALRRSRLRAGVLDSAASRLRPRRRPEGGRRRVTFPGVSLADELERGRAAYESLAWRECYDALSLADERSPLSGADLELLSIAAFMLGGEDEFLQLLERAHQQHFGAGERLRASRCAFWLGMNLALRGEMGPATGWLGRAQRLVEREERECVEQGYMLLPVSFQHEAQGDYDGAAATAAAAAEIGERFGDADLFALAVHVEGNVLVRDGRVKEGLALMDEARVAVSAGELSPIPTGIVYCGVILTCEEIYELRRAREWTAALTRWCDQQPDLLAFTGRCLVH